MMPAGVWLPLLLPDMGAASGCGHFQETMEGELLGLSPPQFSK